MRCLNLELVIPVPAMMEYLSMTCLAVRLLEERDLVTYTELDILCDMQMTLHGHFYIHIVPHAAFCTQPDIMESLIGTGSVILVEERALSVTIDRMVIIVIMT